MATALVRALTIDDTKLWRGGGRLVMGALGTGTFPTVMEDVINLTTMALVAPYVDLGATSDDGFTLTHGWDDVDGIPTDQRDYDLRQGATENAVYGATFTPLQADIDSLVWFWGLDASTTVAQVTGPPIKVAHKKAKLGGSPALTTRIFCILQQNDVSSKMRMFAFRKARIAAPGDLTGNRRTVMSGEVELSFLPDTAITDNSDFGMLFEET